MWSQPLVIADLLATYAGIDERVLKLGVAFRYWAKVHLHTYMYMYMYIVVTDMSVYIVVTYMYMYKCMYMYNHLYVTLYPHACAYMTAIIDTHVHVSQMLCLNPYTLPLPPPPPPPRYAGWICMKRVTIQPSCSC